MAPLRRMIAVTALLLGALAIAPTAHAVSDGGPQINPRTGLPIGFLPTHQQLKHAAAMRNTVTPTPPRLQNFGGPLVSDAQVESVLWGTDPTAYLPQVSGTATPDIGTVTADMLTSEWAAGLSEYTTAAQPIHTGSWLDRRTITPSLAASTATINDATIQTELASQINAGALTAPTANTIYTLYFPSGTTVCDPQPGVSPTPCSNNAFCAYHGATHATIDGTSTTLFYIVQPHPDAHWMSGCSDAGATPLAAMEETTAHELSETITDPEAALATQYGPPLGWYDANYGEIADICEPGGSPVAPATSGVNLTDGSTSYTVSHVWSNRAGGCLPAVPDAPALSATAISGGRAQLAWTQPVDHLAPVTGYTVWMSTPTQAPEPIADAGLQLQWTSPAFANGATPTFYVTARNTVGASELSDPRTVTADSVLPGVTILTPTSQFAAGSALRITWSGTDASGPLRYDAKYVMGNVAGGWSAVRSLATRTLSTAATLPISAGHEYCVKIRAVDTAGNVSGWTAPRCVADAMDDRAFPLAAGWGHSTLSSAYLSTLTSSTTVGASLITSVSASRVGVLVTTCARCGQVGVFMGSTLIARLSTASSSTHYRVLLPTPGFTGRTAGLTLRVLSGMVQLDGAGVWRNAPEF